ncbi:hypothetical protein AB0N07_11030 [Streptomyces sp. NPDC051172]|uniref:hypothetical protein n=1 Tax=Streptomyces sp. NPDC051172 TaxID=3155796 RepID=UPI00343921AD
MLRHRVAVAISCPLAQGNATAHAPELAVSLNNLGIHLAAAERRAEALATAEEAVQVTLRLAEAVPVARQSALAAALHNLAIQPAGAGGSRTPWKR